MVSESDHDGRVPVVPRVLPRRTGPVRAEVISIGRDLLNGHTGDRNGRFLAGQIRQRGGEIGRITVVGDLETSIAAAVREALERNPHLLITSGGLGPAPDDCAKAAVATVLSLPVTLHTGARTLVEKAYRKLADARILPSGGINAERERLCKLPVGSEAVANDLGVAPGFICRMASGAAILCLPGRPEEMRAVFQAAVPLLKDVLPRDKLAQCEIESPTADETSLRGTLQKLADEFPTVWVSSRPSGSRKGAKIVITFEATGPTREEADGVLQAVQRRLRALVAGAD